MGRRSRKPRDVDPPLTRPAPLEPEDEQFDEYEDDDDPDLAGMNDPNVENLGEPPLLGVHTERAGSGSVFDPGGAVGRPTSPPLWGQVANFPAIQQLRVWRIENGVPSGLGTIDARASEEDFVRTFFGAMPRPGEGKFQFRFRPLDSNGRELAKEFGVTISEHHAALQTLRAAAAAQAGNGPPWGRGDVHVHSNGTDMTNQAWTVAAEEAGRAWQTAVEMQEEQTKLYQGQLEREREALREQEKLRAEERVATAERSANVVEKMTEKLMSTDRQRSEEVMRAQKDTNQVVLSTITTVFQQTQEAQRIAAERQRALDLEREKQNLEFLDRQRKEAEERRRHEREEAEERRKLEREELEGRRKLEREEWERKWVQAQAESREERDRWRGELEEKRRVEREELERKEKDIERRERLEREDRERRERAEREDRDRAERRRQEELALQLKSMEVASQRDREHAERMMATAAAEREAQRQAQMQLEKIEREAREFSEKERERQHALVLRELEMSRERDREHAERMISLQKERMAGGLGSLTDLVGMDTPELLARLFGAATGDGEGTTWAEAIPKALVGIAELAKTFSGAQQKVQLEDKQPRPRQIVGQPRTVVQGPTGPQTVGTVGNVPLSETGFRPPGQQGGDEAEAEENNGHRRLRRRQEESPAPKVDDPLAETRQRLRVAAAVPAMHRASAAGLDLATQRSARRAIRELLKSFKSTEVAEWPGVVTAAIMKTPAIYEYLRAVTVYVALAETKVEVAFAEQIVKSLRVELPKTLAELGLNANVVLPFDEADFEKMLAVEAIKVAKDVVAGEKEADAKEASPVEGS